MLPSSCLSPLSIVERMSNFSFSRRSVICLSRPPTSVLILSMMSFFTSSRSLATRALASARRFSAALICSSTSWNLVVVSFWSCWCLAVSCSMSASCCACFAFCSASMRCSISRTSVTLARAAFLRSAILSVTSDMPAAMSLRITSFSSWASCSRVVICFFILLLSAFCSRTWRSMALTSFRVCHTRSRTTCLLHDLCACP